MGAVVKVVTEEDMLVLEKYLIEEGVVLISDKIAKQLPEVTDGMVIDYDFGGDPDVMVDVIRDNTHYFLITSETGG